MDRRVFLLGLLALSACNSRQVTDRPQSHVKQMAITMDDFSLNFDIGLSKQARHESILDAFESVNHKAAGFVTGQFVDSDWGRKVITDWINGGHVIANHTWTHPRASDTQTETYLFNIQCNQNMLDQLPGTDDFFRFPFLQDGRDLQQQIALFNGIAAMGLTNAPVTIDTVDWFTTSRLEAALRADPNTDLAPYGAYYVDMCVQLANHWDAVAQALGFISLPHQMLMHHNILNGHFLKDVLLALKADGWRFIDAREALEYAPYHAMPVEPTNGRNWLTLKAIEMEITPPAYPKKYLRFGGKAMDALGL